MDRVCIVVHRCDHGLISQDSGKCVLPVRQKQLPIHAGAELDGQRGLMEFAGDATLMYYLMEEAQEGKNAFLEKRDPDFQKFPKFPG